MKSWRKPEAVCQQFAANEYVSACEPKIYTFECNTEWGNVYCDNPADQELLDSLIPYAYTNRAAGCGISHEYTGDEKLVTGWSDYNGNNVKDSGEEILIWFDQTDGAYTFADIHLTNNINQNSWDSNKS